MGLAWQVSDEDVAAVLKRHGIQDVTVAEHAIDLCQGRYADRIERTALGHDELQDQTSAALDEIEVVLIEEGLIQGRSGRQR